VRVTSRPVNDVIGREQQTKRPTTGSPIMTGIQGFFRTQTPAFPNPNTRWQPRNSRPEQLVFKALTSAEELDDFSASPQFAGTD
jgi:hypothetical protein